MTIDDIPVELTGEEKNLLEVIRKDRHRAAHLLLPLRAFRIRRMPHVHGRGRAGAIIHAACSTPPKAGMTDIHQHRSRLRKYRRNILELLLANHCRDCTTCEKSSDCKLQQLAQALSHNRGALPKRTDKARPGLIPPPVSPSITANAYSAATA